MDALRPPPWWIFHVPHDSVLVPAEVRSQLLLSDDQLEIELLRMTDRHTFALFAADLPGQQVVRAPVSRLVVDVERFEDDAQEPMADRGMGVIYTATHDRRPLRSPPSRAEREALLEKWYRPHHRALTDAVDQALDRYDKAFVVDAHSYPSVALPYEVDPTALRPQICIGTDSFHTPADLVLRFQQELTRAGLEVAINTPFAGALVPLKHYGQDRRVTALMIELRRDLYMNESSGLLEDDGREIASTIRGALVRTYSAIAQ